MFAVMSFPSISLGFLEVVARPAHPVVDDAESNTIIKLSLPPGEIVQDGIEIENNSSQKKILRLFAVDAALLPDGSYLCEEPYSEKNGAGAWLFSRKNVVQSLPQAKRIIDFNVKVPPKTLPGEYDACIFIEETISFADGNADEAAVFRKGIPVHISVTNQTVQKVSMQRFSIFEKPQHDDLPATIVFASTLENNGNKAAEISAAVIIRPLLGNAIQTVETHVSVPEGRTTEWRFEMESSFWGGIYRAEHTADYPHIIPLDDAQKYQKNFTTPTFLNKSQDLRIDITNPSLWTNPNGNIVHLRSGTLWFVVPPTLFGLLIECVLLTLVSYGLWLIYRQWRSGLPPKCTWCHAEVPLFARKSHQSKCKK